jgi:hypothetical protein
MSLSLVDRALRRAMFSRARRRFQHRAAERSIHLFDIERSVPVRF